MEFDGPSERILSPAVRPEEHAAIAAAWSAGDFERAARLTRTLSELDDRRMILLPLITEWGKTNPAAAAEFARRSPAGVERREFLETAIRAWAESDVVAASAWLGALEPHDDFDAAAGVIATNESLLAAQPAIAAKWAESIGARALRTEVIAAVAIDWARRDAAEAAHYAANCTALTAPEREHLLAQVRRWSGPAE